MQSPVILICGEEQSLSLSLSHVSLRLPNLQCHLQHIGQDSEELQVLTLLWSIRQSDIIHLGVMVSRMTHNSQEIL